MTAGTQGEMALYADDSGGFGEALETCDPRVEIPEPPYFAIGAEVMFGLIGGGGGVIWLPGSGPIPVDPEPFKAVFDALPAMVGGYADLRELDARLREVQDGLDAERTAWTELDDPAGTLDAPFGGGPGVVLVVPRDEAAAVAWLSENREKLAEQAHVTVVALEADGPGVEALAAW